MSLYISFTSPEVFIQWVFFQKNGGTGNEGEFCSGHNYRYHQRHSKSTSWLEVGLPSFAMAQDMKTIALSFHSWASQNLDQRIIKTFMMYGLGKEWSERERGIERNVIDPTSWEEAVYLDVGYFSS